MHGNIKKNLKNHQGKYKGKKFFLFNKYKWNIKIEQLKRQRQFLPL